MQTAAFSIGVLTDILHSGRDHTPAWEPTWLGLKSGSHWRRCCDEFHIFTYLKAPGWYMRPMETREVFSHCPVCFDGLESR